MGCGLSAERRGQVACRSGELRQAALANLRAAIRHCYQQREHLDHYGLTLTAAVRRDAEQAALDFREKYAKEIAEDPELIDVFWQSVRLSAEED